MKRTVSLLAVLTAALISFAALQPTDKTQAQGKGKPADAKTVYQGQCTKCHADDGKGIPSLPDIPNFADAKWQSSTTDKKITDVINVGAGIMPGFKETLSVAEVRALVRYIRGFAPASKAKAKSR